MNQRNLVILRATSGSGKNSFCDLIIGPKIVISADDFFTDSQGNYNWKAELLGRAHEDCRHRFDWALKNGVGTIIINNVNAKPSDWKYYENKALENGLRVTFVVLEHRHDGENSHNVPQQTLERQANTIKENLKLL